MSPLDIVFGVALIAASAFTILAIGLCRAAAKPRPTNAAPAPEVQPVQGRATTPCVVQWCPTSDAQNSWKGFPLCEVHFADLMNAHVLVVRDATGDVLAEEATAYLRKEGGAA